MAGFSVNFNYRSNGAEIAQTDASALSDLADQLDKVANTTAAKTADMDSDFSAMAGKLRSLAEQASDLPMAMQDGLGGMQESVDKAVEDIDPTDKVVGNVKERLPAALESMKFNAGFAMPGIADALAKGGTAEDMVTSLGESLGSFAMFAPLGIGVGASILGGIVTYLGEHPEQAKAAINDLFGSNSADAADGIVKSLTEGLQKFTSQKEQLKFSADVDLAVDNFDKFTDELTADLSKPQFQALVNVAAKDLGKDLGVLAENIAKAAFTAFIHGDVTQAENTVIRFAEQVANQAVAKPIEADVSRALRDIESFEHRAGERIVKGVEVGISASAQGLINELHRVEYSVPGWLLNIIENGVGGIVSDITALTRLGQSNN